jgi:hypothetical protein
MRSLQEAPELFIFHAYISEITKRISMKRGMGYLKLQVNFIFVRACQLITISHLELHELSKKML